jgi:hypothetical protein
MVSDVEEHLCATCGASLPLTGTFCLACDTPVAAEHNRLSVAETFVAERGRPLRALAIIGGTAVVAGAIGYGAYAMVHKHSDGKAATAAIHGVQVIVRAEGGHVGACPYAKTAMSGRPATSVAECRAVVDSDPQAVIHRLHAVSTKRDGSHGTVVLSGTWVDAHGKTPFHRTMDVVQGQNGWLLVWDGKAISAS